MGKLYLDKLFRSTIDAELPGGEKVRVHAMTGPQRRFRSQSAMATSSRIEARMKDKESEEYASHILPLAIAPRESLNEALAHYARADAARKAGADIEPEYVPFPDEASEEEQRAVLLAREAEDERVDKARLELVQRIVAAAQGEIAAMTDDDARLAVQKKTVEYTTSAAYAEELVSWTIANCVTTPDGKPRFTIDEARGLSDEVKSGLFVEFLEVDGVDPLDLSGQS